MKTLEIIFVLWERPGETEVLECIVNTYLDSFQCEKIKITEAGRTFETSGAVLAGYMTKQ